MVRWSDRETTEEVIIIVQVRPRALGEGGGVRG